MTAINKHNTVIYSLDDSYRVNIESNLVSIYYFLDALAKIICENLSGDLTRLLQHPNFSFVFRTHNDIRCETDVHLDTQNNNKV